HFVLPNFGHSCPIPGRLIPCPFQAVRLVREGVGHNKASIRSMISITRPGAKGIQTASFRSSEADKQLGSCFMRLHGCSGRRRLWKNSRCGKCGNRTPTARIAAAKPGLARAVAPAAKIDRLALKEGQRNPGGRCATEPSTRRSPGGNE